MQSEVGEELYIHEKKVATTIYGQDRIQAAR
jgi:hypothetical protein